jgi:outer membrane protein assembly factor BamE
MQFASRLLLTSVLLTSLGACALYRPEIQQGNLITAEQVAQLKVGMTRTQVQAVLGTPLLVDVFHANRWDYPYRTRRGSSPVEQRQFTVIFDGEKVKSFEGDPQPSERDPVTSASPQS